MLNELFELSEALRHYGLLQSTTHPNINSVGKGYCLLIDLDMEGIPRETRLLQKTDSTVLWKHSKGNHNSFPAIRVQKPLLAATESKKINDISWADLKLSEKISHLQTLNFHSMNSECSDIKISEWSLSELDSVLASAYPELAALRQLLSVFPRTADTASFNNKLAELIQYKISSSINEAEIDGFKVLLVGTLDSKEKTYKASYMTYYDVYETDSFDNKVISPATRDALICLLNKRIDEENNLITDSIISPLSGIQSTMIRDKYPNPNIPLLGLTYLYSKKSDIPCLTRYGMSGVEAYKASNNDVMAMNDALAFLTDKSRENKSWKAMSDSNRDKPNLLLAYLADDPQNDALLAKVLSDPIDDESNEELQEETESYFDNLCQQVLGNLDTVKSKNPLSKINLIILETLDPGRKQVVYETAFTSEEFCDNLLQWSEAATNWPDNLSIRVQEKKSFVTYKPICPGPSNICKLLKINYTRSGKSKPMSHSTVSLHDIYMLYMPANKNILRDVAYYFIRKIVESTAQMLGDIGNQMELNYMLLPKEKFLARNAALAISLISILLWRLNIRKEKYMLEAPFNVGQFLQLADKLHKEYCIQVRNGGDKNKSLPTQLMGNEMLAIASVNPIEGFNRLRDRMRIYLAWADTVTGESAGLAKWILARYGEVSTKIVSYDLPNQFNSAEQAQVLLGYLAAIPYNKK